MSAVNQNFVYHVGKKKENVKPATVSAERMKSIRAEVGTYMKLPKDAHGAKR